MVVSIALVMGDTVFFGRGAVFGGVGHEAMATGMGYGGGVTHCLSLVSMMAVTLVLMGVFALRAAGAAGES